MWQLAVFCWYGGERNTNKLSSKLNSSSWFETSDRHFRSSEHWEGLAGLYKETLARGPDTDRWGGYLFTIMVHFPWHRLSMPRRCPGAFWCHLVSFVSSWCSSLLRLDLFVQPRHHALQKRLRSFLALLHLTKPNFAPKSKVLLKGTPAGGSAVALRVAEQPILLGAARNVQKTPIVEFGLFVLHKICACWDAGMASFLDLLTQMSGASPADPPCGPQVHPD